MNISTFKVAMNAFLGWITPGTSAFVKVVDYLLSAISAALAGLDPKVKDNITKVLDTVKKAIEILKKYRKWCPTPWLGCYDATINAVSQVAVSLEDFELTREELEKIQQAFKKAKAAWDAD